MLDASSSFFFVFASTAPNSRTRSSPHPAPPRPRPSGARAPACGEPDLQARQRGEQRRRAGEHDLVLALHPQPRANRAGTAPRRTGPRWARTGSPKSVLCGGDVLADRPGLGAKARLDGLGGGLDGHRVGALLGVGSRSQSSRGNLASTGSHIGARRRHAPEQAQRANSTRSRRCRNGLDVGRVLLGREHLLEQAGCVSPKMPRVFVGQDAVKASTSRASNTSRPDPRCTCSSRSATWRKLSPGASSAACSFSSTVAHLLRALLVNRPAAQQPLLDGVAREQAALVNVGNLAQLLGLRARGIAGVHERAASAASPRNAAIISWRVPLAYRATSSRSSRARNRSPSSRRARANQRSRAGLSRGQREQDPIDHR